MPGISNVNVLAGQPTSNHAIVGVGSGYGVATANAYGTVSYLIDIEGYFTP